MSKEYTAEEIKAHTGKDDVWIVVHDKVYNATKFLDEHPGGEEVILDVGGQDASDAFEDVGHSDEAREQLEKLLIGTVKVDPNAPVKPKAQVKQATSTSTNPNGSFGLMLVVVALLAAAVYKFAM
ncbi:hypothetical protein PYCC9005_003598 [Savitreella phatthalungensis]